MGFFCIFSPGNTFSMCRLLKLLSSFCIEWNFRATISVNRSCSLCQKYGKFKHTEPIASLPITQSSLHWHLSSCSSALNWCLGEKAQQSIFSNIYWLRIIELWLKDANSFAKSDFPENNPNWKCGLFIQVPSSICLWSSLWMIS